MDFNVPSICTPVIIYVAVAVLLLLCGSSASMIQYGPITGLVPMSTGSSSQLLSICCHAIILMLLCNFSEKISWVLLAIWLCCLISTVIGGSMSFTIKKL